ncbi:MAG: hypothetical protein ACRDJN_01085 [Chloroflexota bacterium]
MCPRWTFTEPFGPVLTRSAHRTAAAVTLLLQFGQELRWGERRSGGGWPRRGGAPGHAPAPAAARRLGVRLERLYLDRGFAAVAILP